MASTQQYYVSEAELSKLFATSGLPENFQYLFVRDYAALKSDTDTTNTDLSNLEVRVDQTQDSLTLTITRLTAAEDGISDLTVRQNQLESDFEAHTLDRQVHGVFGNAVGDENYATAMVAGVVMLASAVPNATTSTVNVVGNANNAPAAYSQADAVTWVDLIRENKAAINTLTNNLNSAIVIINAMLNSDRAAKQRAL